MSQASGPHGRPLDAEELLAHAAWLRALARSLVGDEHAADDVVQETFAAAVRRPPREPGALRGWLARVARHAAWKSVRGGRRRAARELAAPRRDAEPSAAECVERIEMQRALLDAVQELDEPFRTVIVMRFYDGKTPRAIAVELGLTSEVVWKRLSRATAMLRARLDRRYGRRDAWAVVLVSPLGARSAATWSGAAAAGTGVAIVGTKTALAAAAAIGLGAWLLWPRGSDATNTVATATPTETALVPQARPRPTAAPRTGRSAELETALETAAPPVPRARTHGRVVDADSGEPLVGARVKVVRKSPGGGFQWALTTGADGKFSGEVEEVAKYSDELAWTAVKSDLYVEASARGHIRFYEGPFRGAQGEDLGDIRLDRGVIVRGRVVTSDGRPVARARVFATSGTAFPGTGFPLQEMRALGEADDVGRFELDEALPPTTVANYVYTLMASCPSAVAFTTLAIRSGSDHVDGVVLTMRPGGATVRVKDPDGRPVAGADVWAEPRFEPFPIRMQQDGSVLVVREPTLAPVFTKKTGDDGSARFEGLPTREGLPTGERTSAYDFAASAPGFTVAWAEGAGVGPGADALVEIALKREQSIVAGVRIVDVDDRPVEGVTVVVRHGMGPAAKAASGPDGVAVLARRKGEPGVRFAWVDVAKDGFAAMYAQIDFSPDDGTPLPAIRLERPAPIEGRVVDQDGQPVAEVYVQLMRPGRPLQLSGRGVTGEDGRFVFTDATAGDWTLTVVPPMTGAAYIAPEPRPVPGGKTDVAVRLERLAEGRATIAVDLVDAATGAPVTAVTAILLDAAPVRGRYARHSSQPRVDAGRITIERVRPGNYVLWIRVADRPNQLVRVGVADGDTDVRATCRVRRGVTITGRLLAPPGVDVSDVGVACGPVGDPPTPGALETTSFGRARAAADGTFRIAGLTPAAYHFVTGKRGWFTETIAEASEGDATVDVVLQRGLVATFRGSGPTDAAEVRIEGSLDDGPWTCVAQLWIEEDGDLACTETLRPGRFRWRAVFRRTRAAANDLADAAEPQSGELLLEAGRDVEIVVPVVPRK